MAELNSEFEQNLCGLPRKKRQTVAIESPDHTAGRITRKAWQRAPCPNCGLLVNGKKPKCLCGYDFNEAKTRRRKVKLDNYFKIGQRLKKSRNPGYALEKIQNCLAMLAGLEYDAVLMYVTSGVHKPQIGVLKYTDRVTTLMDSPTGKGLKDLYKAAIMDDRGASKSAKTPALDRISAEKIVKNQSKISKEAEPMDSSANTLEIDRVIEKKLCEKEGTEKLLVTFVGQKQPKWISASNLIS